LRESANHGLLLRLGSIGSAANCGLRCRLKTLGAVAILAQFKKLAVPAVQDDRLALRQHRRQGSLCSLEAGSAFPGIAFLHWALVARNFGER